MSDARPPNRHPPESLLVSHAAGQLPRSRRVIVEAHLAFCAACRRSLGHLSASGVAMLDPALFGGGTARSLDSSSNDAGWSALESRLDDLEPDDETPPFAPAPDLPPGLRGHLPSRLYGQRWRRIPLSSARYTVVDFDAETDASLLMICIGPKRFFPRHRHFGVEDVVVLTGAFRDDSGLYQPGDYQTSEAGTAHRPAVQPGDPCWILTRFEAGVRFTGIRGLVQRLAQGARIR